MPEFQTSNFELRVERKQPLQEEPLSANIGYDGALPQTNARYSSTELVGGFIFVVGRLRRAFVRGKRIATVAVLDIAKNSWRWIVLAGPSTEAGAMFLYDDSLFWRGGSRSGTTGLLRFDLALESWTPVDCIGVEPAAFEHGSAGYLEKINLLVSFGGSLNGVNTNNVYLLQMPQRLRIRPKIKGRKPQRRWQHASCVSNGEFYVYGGWSEQGRLSDIFRLRVDSANRCTWSCTNTGEETIGRISSSGLAPLGNFILIAGGVKSGQPPDPYYLYDTKSQEFLKVQTTPITSLSSRPGFGVCSVALNDKTAILLGGRRSLEWIQRVSLSERS